MKKFVTFAQRNTILTLALFASLPAQAGLIIDDFSFHPSYLNTHPMMPILTANQADPNKYASSTTGNILGGERDVSVNMTELLGQYAQSTVNNGWFGPYNMPMMTIRLDWTGEFSYQIQYDGLDGAATRNGGLGLDLNAALAGDTLQIGYFRQNIYNDNADGDADPTGNTTWDISLVDNNGHVSTVSNTIVGNSLGGFNLLNFNFSDFESNNSLFDISHVSVIEIASTIMAMGPGSSWIELTGIGISGDVYTQTNTPNNNNPQNPSNSVPEPSALALFAFALVAMGIRRKK
ncbi:PEP-CTERM sorting domain-containing protein [Paraglaciecola hydrolytica]|uniref:Ice-binding protein C-terminal domain-containing protein n=1 Tax=Paraglaciecola hydrolytica TaxID=1799789 RepID=A0A136A3B8_9ALTE|nr:PEP-CTERM sorting domain-containing protein [Paraglaciecola hydrolytica]KXI29738.1 hypothetical protein AX660_06770 [Paraglaciecola hydrolytica]